MRTRTALRVWVRRRGPSVDSMTKNLVVCCDGTWKNSDDRYVSNVEKIARSIAPSGFDGETQIVHYARGGLVHE